MHANGRTPGRARRARRTGSRHQEMARGPESLGIRNTAPDPLEGVELFTEAEKHPLPCGCTRGDGKHFWNCTAIKPEQILTDIRDFARRGR